MEPLMEVVKSSIPALILAIAKGLAKALVAKGGITPQEQKLIAFLDALEALFD